MSALRTRALPAPFGAELTDIDLSALGPGAVDSLLELLTEHALLIARHQSLDDAALAALARALGPVAVASRRSALAPGHPEVMYVSNLKDEDGRTIGGLGKEDHGESVWHSDQSFRSDPATLSTLFCVHAPPEGGGTGFLSTVLAWEALTPSLQARLEPLRGRYRPRPVHEIEVVEVTHPAVLTSPSTGRRALYFSELCHGFDGLEPAESDALMAELHAHLAAAQLRYTHTWRMGDIAIYDNAQLLHRREAFSGLRWLKATRSRADPARFALPRP